MEELHFNKKVSSTLEPSSSKTLTINSSPHTMKRKTSSTSKTFKMNSTTLQTEQLPNHKKRAQSIHHLTIPNKVTLPNSQLENLLLLVIQFQIVFRDKLTITSEAQPTHRKWMTGIKLKLEVV